MKRFLHQSFVVILAIFIISACSKDKKLTNEEFAGKYKLPSGSFIAPVDGNGNPINSEKIDISGTLLTVVWDPSKKEYTLTHEYLGTIKAKPTNEDDKISLTISEQPYNGFFNNPDWNMTIAAISKFWFTKDDEGIKLFEASDDLGKFLIYVNLPTQFLRPGTSRFEAQLRRSSRFK
ncbi:MAG: hypothetical protein ABIK31_07495 [candidate division WOR-3 bacterium]